jgi:Recombination endonuclease VII
LWSLANACGLNGNYKPIARVLREAGVSVRPPGPRQGYKSEKPSCRETRVCKRDGCSNTFQCYPSQNKKYCQPECRYSDPEVAALLAGSLTSKHHLTHIDPEQKTAVCSVCGNVKITWRGGKRTYTSDATRSGAWRCHNKAKMRIYATDLRLSVTQYQELLREAGDTCAICSYQFSSNDRCLDHDHKTGRIRGFLCHKCNTGLGLFADSPARLQAAIVYLTCTTSEGEMYK